MIPENFSRTDLELTHIISAEAILALTLVTYFNHIKFNIDRNIKMKKDNKL